MGATDGSAEVEKVPWIGTANESQRTIIPKANQSVIRWLSGAGAIQGGGIASSVGGWVRQDRQGLEGLGKAFLREGSRSRWLSSELEGRRVPSPVGRRIEWRLGGLVGMSRGRGAKVEWRRGNGSTT